MRKVFVIGASGAIGGAIARRELERGADVTGTYRSRPESIPNGVRPVHLDLADRSWDRISAVASPVRGRWSAVYIAAGDPSSRVDWTRLPKRGDGPGVPLTEAEWSEEAAHGLRELRLALLLRDRVNGPIIIVGSSASRWTMPGASTYAATHGAIDGAARSWLAESSVFDRDHGARIRVSRPGVIWGPIWEKLGLRPSDLRIIRALSTSADTYARRVVDYGDSGRRWVHSGTWDAVLSRWVPPALLEPLTAWAMGLLLRRRVTS